MKRFFMLAVAVVLSAVVFSSCKSKFQSDFVDRLPGRWALVNAYPADAETYIRQGDEITFDAEGKAELHTYTSSMFKQLRWAYEADLTTGESWFYVKGEKNMEGEGDIIYLMSGRVATSGEKYMKLQYTDDAYVTYTYELVKK